MKELIIKLEQELGIPFYYISRKEEEFPVVTYNYKKSFHISDVSKESSIFDFYFILIIDKNINETVEKFEDILINNLFRNITVNQSSFTKDNLIQISITATKNLQKRKE